MTTRSQHQQEGRCIEVLPISNEKVLKDLLSEVFTPASLGVVDFSKLYVALRSLQPEQVAALLVEVRELARTSKRPAITHDFTSRARAMNVAVAAH